jgi:hypothetical protein
LEGAAKVVAIVVAVIAAVVVVVVVVVVEVGMSGMIYHPKHYPGALESRWIKIYCEGRRRLV